VLQFFKKKVFLYVGKVLMQVVWQIVAKKLLEEERLYFREDVDAGLLAVEGFKLCVVARLVPFFFHLYQFNYDKHTKPSWLNIVVPSKLEDRLNNFQRSKG
jgi:hypothetical protein